MSNYKKAFNFQNGVQVDDDNFVVTQGGLVGIGTSVPSKVLDVRGNADISGILTTSGMNVGAAISVGSNIIIDAASGIITATKFVGSAGNLSGIVAISTDGFITQAGSLSTTAKVGITTDNPVFDLQIGLNPRTSIGVGITNGDVLISGVTTTGNLVVSGLTTTKDLFASGVSTFTGAIDANDNLDVDGHTELDDLNVSGISTFGGNIDANVDLDVDGHTELDDVKATGVSTFTNIVDLEGPVRDQNDVIANPGTGKTDYRLSSVGTGVSWRPSGVQTKRTIWVSKNGLDSNSGLLEGDAKATIGGAAAIAVENDTIVVRPGVYLENNPIGLRTDVSITGQDLSLIHI